MALQIRYVLHQLLQHLHVLILRRQNVGHEVFPPQSFVLVLPQPVVGQQMNFMYTRQAVRETAIAAISSGVSLKVGITGTRMTSSVMPEAAIFLAFSSIRSFLRPVKASCFAGFICLISIR